MGGRVAKPIEPWMLTSDFDTSDQISHFSQKANTLLYFSYSKIILWKIMFGMVLRSYLQSLDVY